MKKNKKVHKDYESIKDVYVLRCICTELRDELERQKVVNKFLKTTIFWLLLEYTKKENRYE